MQEVITTQTEIVRDPVITAAIRELKSRIKEMAEYQKNGKTAYSESMSKWAKDGYKYGAPCWCDQSMTATALFVIYGKLRQTKRPHLTQEAYDKYYNDPSDLGNQRRRAYRQAAESLPEAARKIILGEVEEMQYQARKAMEKRAAEETAKRKAEQEIRDREAAVRAKQARYARYLELKKEFEQ